VIKLSKVFVTYVNGQVDTCDFTRYDSDDKFIYFYNSEDKLIAMYHMPHIRGIRFQGV
jgi:hypothetical protein